MVFPGRIVDREIRCGIFLKIFQNSRAKPLQVRASDMQKAADLMAPPYHGPKRKGGLFAEFSRVIQNPVRESLILFSPRYFARFQKGLSGKGKVRDVNKAFKLVLGITQQSHNLLVNDSLGEQEIRIGKATDFLVGESLQLPADEGRCPGKSTAKSCKTDQISCFDPAFLMCFAQRNWNRSRSGVAIPHDVVVNLIRSQSHFLHDELADTQIRLMRD